MLLCITSYDGTCAPQVGQMQRRVEEGNEVIDAIKTQLVDYKAIVAIVSVAGSRLRI